MSAIIITGAGGQLGKAFIHQLPFTAGYSLFTFDHHQLDIAAADRVEATLDRLPQAKYWINCAAYTKVDAAEQQVHEATMSNVLAPRYIANACKDRGLHLFHFSSDYVYHNDLRSPLLETDPTTPQGVYAKTKLEGENEIRHSGASHTIIRTSWVYGPGGNNFVNTMLRLGKIKKELSIVGDQLGCPTLTIDIANAVKELLSIHQSGNQSLIQGCFNFCNAGEVTWDNFARIIFEKAGLSCKVNSITTAEYGAAAPRPAYSVMNCDKISALLAKPIPSWRGSLDTYLRSLDSQ